MSEHAPPYPSTQALKCPYMYYAESREHAPVMKADGRDEYLVFRMADIDHVLRNDAVLFSAEAGRTSNGLDYGGAHHIGVSDPPIHTVNRRLLSTPFTPANQRALEPRITRIVDTLIDSFIDRGHVELVSQFAFLVPANVTCEITGLPRAGEEFDFIRRWSTELGRAEPNVTVEEFDRMADYIAALVHARHADPQTDIVSELIARQTARDGRFDHALNTTLTLELLAGGVITTGQMVTSAMLLLLQNPEQMAYVRDDHRRIPAMLEEALRVEPPVHWRQRFAKQEVTLSGVTIPAGATLTLVYGSANRDPERFDAADAFDVRRANARQHLSFGKGLHFCLGAPLARTEGRVVFERLFTRLGAIGLDADRNDFRPIDSPLFRSPAKLYLRFTAAG
jgi:cytochrome P450